MFEPTQQSIQYPTVEFNTICPTDIELLNLYKDAIRNGTDNIDQYIDMYYKALYQYAANSRFTDQSVLSVLIDPYFTDRMYFYLDTHKVETIYLIMMNKVFYWYFKFDITVRNKNVSNGLLRLAERVNDTTLKLLATEKGQVNHETLVRIAVAYRSDEDYRKCIKHVVRQIQHSSNVEMTEQEIVNIFTILFQSFHMSDVFATIMLDKFTTFRNDSESELYSLVNLTLLDILENMSLHDIYEVLSRYADEKQMRHLDARFSMLSNSRGDYPRINQIVDQLVSEGKELR